MNTPYELHKVEREIKTHGSAYSFERIPVDDYGEYKLGEPREQVCTINGIYHISKGYITQTGTDASTVRSKGQPMILCVIDDNSKKIKNNDICFLNGAFYKVIEKNDIQNYGIIYDISLEVVLNGGDV